MAEVEVGGVTFTYAEASFGTGRGVTISGAGESRRYNFKPNPHNEDKWYNKNQGAFYREAATAIGNAVNAGAWPDEGTIEVHGHDYQLQVR